MKRSRCAALLLLLLAWVGSAAAHSGGATGFAKISAHGQTVRFSLSLGPDIMAGAAFTRVTESRRGGAPDYDALAGVVARHIAVLADGRPCEPTLGAVTPPFGDRAMAVVLVHYACAAPVRELTVRDDLSDVFGADYHTLASFERRSGAEQVVFQPDRRVVRLAMTGEPAEAPAAPAALSGAPAFFLLGVEHILLGFDHILFLLALVLRGGRLLSLLAIVTAFTISHSITLALSVLDVARLPPGFVEPVIALSIAYVALENIFSKSPVSRRWAVSFLFGLVHGFGFAGVLAELELPIEGLAVSLLSFNFGVEIGQAFVIAVLLPPLLWMRRFRWQVRAVTTASAVLVVVGLSLLVERTVA
jgi:hydrogenase/urease accessory protein HupE